MTPDDQHDVTLFLLPGGPVAGRWEPFDDEYATDDPQFARALISVELGDWMIIVQSPNAHPFADNSELMFTHLERYDSPNERLLSLLFEQPGHQDLAWKWAQLDGAEVLLVDLEPINIDASLVIPRAIYDKEV